MINHRTLTIAYIRQRRGHEAECRALGLLIFLHQYFSLCMFMCLCVAELRPLSMDPPQDRLQTHVGYRVKYQRQKSNIKSIK